MVQRVYLCMKWSQLKSRFLEGQSGSVFRGMLMLASGSAIAKGIGLASIPVITRIYTPEDMGLLSVFTSLVAILVPLATLRYVTVLPLPKQDAVAMNLFALNFFVLIAFTALLSALAWTAGPLLLGLLSLEALTPYLPLLVAGVFATALYELLKLWGIRKKSYKVLAKSSASQALTGNITKIALGLLALKPAGLILGQIAQQGGGLLPLVKLWLRDVRQHWQHLRPSLVLKLALHFSDMPRYRLPSQLLLMLAMQAPLLFSAKLYGIEVTGQLGLALMSLSLPVNLLGSSTGQAYFAEISSLGRNQPERILQISKDVTRRLLFLSLPPALLLLATGPQLFQLAFGEEWALAGTFARILAIYLLLQFISSPLANALTLYQRQDLFLIINLVRVFIVAAIFLAAHIFTLPVEQTMLIYSLLLSGIYFMTNRLVFSVISKQSRKQES